MRESERRGVETPVQQSVAVENADGAGLYVIVCDHASNRIPIKYGDLGLTESERAAHIAWDPGALGVAQHLATMLDAPLVRSTVSRLVIDCNRDPADPDSIVERSLVSGITVPGNIDLAAKEREQRAAEVHTPYHAMIETVLDRRRATSRPTSLIAIHSFTRVFGAILRPWEVGILFDRHRALADILVDGCRAEGLNVGVNEPYSPADRVYYTLSRHAEARGLACAMIEIRNDLLETEEAQRNWAARLARLLAATNAARKML